MRIKDIAKRIVHGGVQILKKRQWTGVLPTDFGPGKILSITVAIRSIPIGRGSFPLAIM